VLAPIFHAAIGEADADWAAHLAKLRRFWSAVMLRSGAYHGDPYSAHLRLPGLAPEMFGRWLALFEATCGDIFPPTTAAAFCERAHRIARSLQMGLFERLPPVRQIAE
jgi:hemoglobin